MPGCLRSGLSWLTGGFLLLRNLSVAISEGPHICFILVLIVVSMFLECAFVGWESSTRAEHLGVWKAGTEPGAGVGRPRVG